MFRIHLANHWTAPMNWAEWLLELGRAVRKRIRRGAGLEDACQRFGATDEECFLALAFVSSDDLVKLRALVEDWPLARIIQQTAGAQPAWSGPQTPVAR